jgi:hypothetical protein
MGLLNYLFGRKSNITAELVMDDKKRMALWEEHVSNFKLREELSKNFNSKNIEQAIQNFDNTQRIMNEIEKLISPELISIGEEEKTDAKILADLNKLKDRVKLDRLNESIISAKQKQVLLIELFHEIYKVLSAELHLIRIIRKKPENLRELLAALFEIIFHQEARLNKIFRVQTFMEENRHIHENIMRIARTILLEEEIKEEMETDAEKFANAMIKKMGPHESKGIYRKLGEDIFQELAEMAGAPLAKKRDILEGINQMERLMEKDELMYALVKRLRPKYDDNKIKGAILAFRQAYNLGHFEDLSSEFAT